MRLHKIPFVLKVVASSILAGFGGFLFMVFIIMSAPHNDETFGEVVASIGRGLNHVLEDQMKTLLEIDHDFMPKHSDEEGLLNWARAVRAALACRQQEKLPRGVERVGEKNE